jgi:hypothetical protein
MMGLQKSKWVHLLRVPTFLFLVALLSGCDWRELIRPAAQKDRKADEQSDRAAEPSKGLLTQGERFAFHRWLVAEMQDQIFAGKTRGSTSVNDWANVLSQRGSIEGVYRGLVLSSEYASLERGRAEMRALRFFSQEMAALDHPNSNDGAEPVRAAREAYAKEYMGSSLFTLKRILGDKIIQQSNIRKSDRDRLAGWYASFVGRWNKAGVSFGMPDRNRDDEAFHFRWARENSLGMIQWELLNRAHRIMNEYGGVPVPQQPASSETQAKPQSEPSQADK